ncbi:universal stress protein [Sphingobium olei]|uniref:Universal stress protein n=1 Tax=Sphingobium olei TaxID=420955 RepID=A0ABW3P095_9SPHN
MHSVLVATDFSPRADRALRRAVLVARQFSAGLVLLHALDDELPETLLAIQRDSSEGLLAETAATISSSDQVDCTYRLVMGDPFRALVDAARELEPDLVVMGPHRRNLLKDIFVGTTAERTIRESATPILMANGMPASPYQRIMIATDLSECSLEAAKAAMELGLLAEAHLEILHVFDTPERSMMQRSMMTGDEVEDYTATVRAEAINDLRSFLSEAGIQPDRKTVQAIELSVPDTILSAARKAQIDLLVIGMHGRTGLEKFFLGSVAEEVLRYAKVDVLVIPSATRSRDSEEPAGMGNE